MKLTIDNNDGLGQQDYSAYFDAGKLPTLKRRLNRPTEMQAWLVSSDAAFRIQASGVKLVARNQQSVRIDQRSSLKIPMSYL